MAPNKGLVHQKEYDWRDSNVELIGTDIDHKVKYNSAVTEPAWSGIVDGEGTEEGEKLRIWRIEDFQVVPWPQDRYGDFYEGDSYIVLHSYAVGTGANQKMVHDIFFWLGSQTTQDEAGTAAYKTVELDELLKGAATQHRELQREPSDDFVALFPRVRILRGGVRSGFRHVDEDEGQDEEQMMLLRIFKLPRPSSSTPGKRSRAADSTMVVEVEPSWRSLDEGDVFVLEKMGGGSDKKIWVWQGQKCSPMEKAKAAQVVHDMTLAKHVDVEVLSQTESRSRTVVTMLGAGGDEAMGPFHAPRPVHSASSTEQPGNSDGRPRKLFRLSDASGRLTFSLVKEGGGMDMSDLDGNDVFLLDTGSAIWVWQGAGASRGEKAMWIRVAESYLRDLLAAAGEGDETTYLSPISKVVEGCESPAFVKALET